MMSRRIRKLQIDLHTLAQIILGDPDDTLMPHYKVNGIPSDAEVVNLRLDDQYLDRLYVYIYSPSFDVVAEGAEVPDLIVTTSVYYCPEMIKERVSL